MSKIEKLLDVDFEQIKRNIMIILVFILGGFFVYLFFLFDIGYAIWFTLIGLIVYSISAIVLFLYYKTNKRKLKESLKGFPVLMLLIVNKKEKKTNFMDLFVKHIITTKIESKNAYFIESVNDVQNFYLFTDLIIKNPIEDLLYFDDFSTYTNGLLIQAQKGSFLVLEDTNKLIEKEGIPIPCYKLIYSVQK
jgi:Ca2+/Na+ antiporter